jgi:hypothetical protein
MSSLEPAAQVWVRGFATRSFAADRGPRATFAANDPNGEHTVTTDESAQIWTSHASRVAGLADLIADTSIELDEVSLAEGYRHLTRILHMGMLSVHDYGSTTDPQVYLAKTPTQLTGGVTSDCMYYESFFDGARTYRLSGTRGSAPLLEITMIAGKIGITDRGDMIDSIREDTLVVEGKGPDARFEVTMSPDPKPAGFDGNWLQTEHPDRGRATYMIIRQYSTDTSNLVPAKIEIEPVGWERSRDLISLADMDQALRESASFTEVLVRHWTAMSAAMIEHLPNQFLIVSGAAAEDEPMPTGHRFSTAGFKLEPGQAWVITIPGIGGHPYDTAPYWGLQLCNYWFEPLDYGDTWGHINMASATYGEDGSVTVVVSEQDPGDMANNWLQLRGHTMGSAQFRLSRIRAPLPEIECRVVSFSDLRSFL